MAIKCIVIGEQPPDTRKRITFEHVLLVDLVVTKTNIRPEHSKYIELICKNYIPGKDLMFAYNNPSNRSQGSLIIGQWNDGVA